MFLRVLLVFSFLGLSWTAAAQAEPTTAAEYVQHGIESAEEQDYEAATADFRAYVEMVGEANTRQQVLDFIKQLEQTLTEGQ